MKTFTCPKCGCSIISNNNLTQTCNYCGSKVTTPPVEGYNRTIELKKRQKEDFENFKRTVSKAHQQNSSTSSSSYSPAPKKGKQKKEHGIMYYVFIGMVSYFIASALSLGFIGFIIVAVVLLALF